MATDGQGVYTMVGARVNATRPSLGDGTSVHMQHKPQAFLFHVARAATLALVGAPAAWAGQATASFQILVTVVDACQVNTRTLVLAPHVSGGPATGTATPGVIEVSCTQGTPATVYLDGPSLLYGPNGETVAYTLKANGKAWPAGDPVRVQGQGKKAVRLVVTGAVGAGQHAAPGAYATDQIVRVVY